MTHIFTQFVSKHCNPRMIGQFSRSIVTLNSSVQLCRFNCPLKSTNLNAYLSKSPLNIQKRCFAGYLEEFYTTSNASTGFSTPLRSLFIYSIVVLQTALVFGTLFHTNYYFTGRILPKADGNTQLCSDV